MRLTAIRRAKNSMSELGRGAVFAGFRVEGVLGRGGMGIVYRATELELDRTIALKLIATERASDPGFRRRFEREARLAASIEHPNVLPVYRVGEADGLLYLAMRYVDGTDLRARLVHRRRLAPPEAIGLVAQVAAALDAAHAVGLVHRDVKPANVLIGGDDATPHAYLADFGVARPTLSRSPITRAGDVVGTLGYSAPEQLEGRAVDGRADVYSLGCVLYEALTGRIPFDRSTDAATLLAHLHDAPAPVSDVADVAAGLDSVLARALAKSPAERYRSAGELAQAARAAVEPGGAPARAATADAIPTAPDAAAPKRRRSHRPGTFTRAIRGHRLLAVGGTIAAVAGAGAAGRLLADDGAKVTGGDRSEQVADPGLANPVVLPDEDPDRDRWPPEEMETAAQIKAAVAEFGRSYAAGDWLAVRELLTRDVSLDAFHHLEGEDFPVVFGGKGVGKALDYLRQGYALRDVSSYRITRLQIGPGYHGIADWRYELRLADGTAAPGQVEAQLRRDGDAARFSQLYIREER